MSIRHYTGIQEDTNESLVETEECHVAWPVKQIGEANKCICSFQVQDENCSNEGHALDVSYVGTVTDIRSQQAVQHVIVRPTLKNKTNFCSKPARSLEYSRTIGWDCDITTMCNTIITKLSWPCNRSSTASDIANTLVQSIFICSTSEVLTSLDMAFLCILLC
jgi:hypothetical protein